MVVCLALAWSEARADVRLNSLFADNMVLQRDKPIRVWGLADPGEEVNVSLAGKEAAAKADKDGRWSVELPALKEGENLELTVSGKNPSSPAGSAAASTVTLKNIVMGDVWVCGGQSNMSFELKDCRDSADDIKTAELPKIRCMQMNRVAMSFFPEHNTAVGRAWQVCTPKTAGGFTAVGFYFAREIHAKTGVPIGLLDVNRGGTGINVWTPPDENDQSGAEKTVANYVKNHDLMAKWLAAAREALKDGRLPDSDGKTNAPTPSVSVKSLDEWERWITIAQAALKNRQLVNEKGERLPLPPKLTYRWSKENPAITPIDPGAMDPGPAACWWGKAEPGCFYRGIVNPLARFPITGAIWYQGESDAWRKNGDPQYALKQKRLVERWRKAWGQGDFPFYYVQLPALSLPEFPNSPAGGIGWTNVREAQLKCMSIPNTGMTIALDIGGGNLHPPSKYDFGLRLARWALARDYGFKDIEVSGPIYKEMKVEGDKIRISFDHAESGLMVGSKQGREPVAEDKEGKLKWFAIAASSNQWTWADAVIDGKTVVVSSPEVKTPLAVRYAYIQDPAGANLYNRDGLPASPFRTDNW
jgi:sialate O-acetylesterase